MPDDGIRLVASMIARDELGRYQPDLARHLLDFCDEVRVLDDCSEDETARELDQLDWRVHVKRVMGASYWQEWGEGAARQMLLDWTVEGKPTHVLAVDADEYIPDGQKLREVIARNPDCDVFTLRMVEIWNRAGDPWKMRVDGGWAPRQVPICWRVPPPVIRDTLELPDGWQIADRKLASGREPEIVAALTGLGDFIDTGVDICHLGWSNRDQRRPRYERYMQIDGGRFHADAHLRSIMEPPTLEPYPAYPV